MSYWTSRELDYIHDSQKKYDFLFQGVRIKESRPSRKAGFEVTADIVTAVKCGHQIYVKDISPSQLEEDLKNLLRREMYEEIFQIFQRLWRENEYGRFLVKDTYATGIGAGDACSNVLGAMIMMRQVDYFFFFFFMREVTYHQTPLKLEAEGGMVNGGWELKDLSVEEEPKILAEGYYSFRRNRLQDEDKKKIEEAIKPLLGHQIKEVEDDLARFKERYPDQLIHNHKKMAVGVSQFAKENLSEEECRELESWLPSEVIPSGEFCQHESDVELFRLENGETAHPRMLEIE